MAKHGDIVDGFELVELFSDASEDEVASIADVWAESLKDESTWQIMVRNLSPQENRAWVRLLLLDNRIVDPKMRTFVIRDKSNQQIVAWTMLQVPHVSTDEDTRRDALQKEKVMRDMPDKVDKGFFAFFASGLANTSKDLGYDPERHLHKRTTVCLPTHQRKGLGVWLTAHCNTIADEHNQPTYVLARAKAWGMLEKCGFGLGKTIQHDLTKFGGPRELEYRVYVRQPLPN